MSYDLRFAVKAENGQYVVFREPVFCNPTYNVGTIFRKAMDFDFKQSEFYKVSEIRENLVKGYTEARFSPSKYREFEPENHWGTVETVANCLLSVLDTIEEIEREAIPLDCVYLAW